LALALDRVRSSGEFTEATILAMIDVIMGAAINFKKSDPRLSGNNVGSSTCFFHQTADLKLL